MNNDTVTTGNKWWAGMQASFTLGENNRIERGTIQYTYSPAYKEILETQWFWLVWQAQTIVLHARRKRLEALAREWGLV